MPIKYQSNSAPWAADWGSTQYSGSNLIWEDSLDVSVSNSPGYENPFGSTHKTLTGSIGHFIGPNDWGGKRFRISGPSSLGNAAYRFASNPSWNAANLWARSNPTSPVVNLPVFWVELKDLPDMLRQAGRFLAAGRKWRQYLRSQHQTRDLATANLAFQFGWAPLIGDLYKLATFQDAVDKRRKHLLGRQRDGVQRAGFPVGSTSFSGSSSSTANFGNYRNFSIGLRWTGSSESWCVLKWRPTSGGKLLPPKDDDLRPYLLGLHPSQIAINVWEALPWSWLVDYFTNIGDIIKAGNHHAYTPVGGSVMTKKTTDLIHSRKQIQYDELTDGSLKQVAHYRASVGASTLTARLPNLGAGQLSILSSLAFLKGGKRLGLG